MNVRLKYHGPSHLTLLYLQMKRKPVKKQDISKFYSHVFRDAQVINRIVISLKGHGFIVETPDGYAITNWGSHYLHSVAKKYQGSNKERASKING